MKYLIPAVLLLLGNVSRAQSYEGTVRHRNSDLPAAVLEVPYPTDMVMAAMAGYLTKKMKSAETDIKGFATFRNSQMPDTGENADLYFRVEGKNRQEKELSVIYLMLTTIKTDQVPADTLRYLDMKEARAYLDDLALAITAYDLEKQLSRLNDEIRFAESVYANLEDDRRQIEREQKTLDSKTDANAKALLNKKQEIEMQKQRHAALERRRK